VLTAYASSGMIDKSLVRMIDETLRQKRNLSAFAAQKCLKSALSAHI
jgi:hypothetical protein